MWSCDLTKKKWISARCYFRLCSIQPPLARYNEAMSYIYASNNNENGYNRRNERIEFDGWLYRVKRSKRLDVGWSVLMKFKTLLSTVWSDCVVQSDEVCSNDTRSTSRFYRFCHDVRRCIVLVDVLETIYERKKNSMVPRDSKISSVFLWFVFLNKKKLLFRYTDDLSFKSFVDAFTEWKWKDVVLIW